MYVKKSPISYTKRSSQFYPYENQWELPLEATSEELAIQSLNYQKQI